MEVDVEEDVEEGKESWMMQVTSSLPLPSGEILQLLASHPDTIVYS